MYPIQQFPWVLKQAFKFTYCPLGPLTHLVEHWPKMSATVNALDLFRSERGLFTMKTSTGFSCKTSTSSAIYNAGSFLTTNTNADTVLFFKASRTGLATTVSGVARHFWDVRNTNAKRVCSKLCIENRKEHVSMTVQAFQCKHASIIIINF